MLSQRNLPIIDPITVTFGAVTLYGFYTIASLAIRRANRSYYAWKNRKPSLPLVPQEIQNIVLTSILESESPSKWTELLQLSLVCKNWNRFINNHWIWATRHSYMSEDYERNCSVLPSKIRSFWLRDKVQSDFYLPTILNPTKRAQYEQYTPWMSHNVFKYPEILFNFLRSIIMVPEWMYFLIVGRVRSRRGFVRNEDNVRKILYMQRVLFVFTTAFPFMAILISGLKTTVLSHFMNSSSIWYAPWMTPRLAVGFQLRLLSILFAFLPFDLSLYLPEVCIPRALLYLVMAAANGGLAPLAATIAGALGIRKLLNRENIIPLPYWMLAFIIAYPFSALISLALAGVVFFDMSLKNSMKPPLRSYRNAKYWLIIGVFITGAVLLLS